MDRTAQPRSPAPTRLEHLGNRLVILASTVAALGTLFLRPGGGLLVIGDLLARTYCMFVGTVMAHERVHGHLGRTKAANFWWARLALLPALIDLGLNYLGLFAVHGPLTNPALVGTARYVSGMAPALVTVSLLLWYPFAIKTHERLPFERLSRTAEHP